MKLTNKHHSKVDNQRNWNSHHIKWYAYNQFTLQAEHNDYSEQLCNEYYGRNEGNKFRFIPFHTQLLADIIVFNSCLLFYFFSPSESYPAILRSFLYGMTRIMLFKILITTFRIAAGNFYRNRFFCIHRYTTNTRT